MLENIEEVLQATKPAVPPRRVWDNYKVIGTVRKNDKLKYQIAACVRDGVRYLYIREFYYRKREQDWAPGVDGISVPLKQPIKQGTEIIKPLENLIAALLDAIPTLVDMPLYDAENAVYVGDYKSKKDRFKSGEGRNRR